MLARIITQQGASIISFTIKLLPGENRYGVLLACVIWLLPVHVHITFLIAPLTSWKKSKGQPLSSITPQKQCLTCGHFLVLWNYLCSCAHHHLELSENCFVWYSPTAAMTKVAAVGHSLILSLNKVLTIYYVTDSGPAASDIAETNLSKILWEVLL